MIARLVDPCPCPIMVVATKYDLLANEDSAKRKVLLGALRYVAHSNGASLHCFSRRDKVLQSHFRALMNHHAFRTAPKKSAQLDAAKPVVIPAGADAIKKIGAPMGSDLKDFLEVRGPPSVYATELPDGPVCFFFLLLLPAFVVLGSDFCFFACLLVACLLACLLVCCFCLFSFPLPARVAPSLTQGGFEKFGRLRLARWKEAVEAPDIFMPLGDEDEMDGWVMYCAVMCILSIVPCMYSVLHGRSMGSGVALCRPP